MKMSNLNPLRIPFWLRAGGWVLRAQPVSLSSATINPIPRWWSSGKWEKIQHICNFYFMLLGQQEKRRAVDLFTPAAARMGSYLLSLQIANFILQ